MKKLYAIALLVLIPFCTWAQTINLSPSITPALFQHNTQITVVYDVTGTSLANLTDAFAWVWIPGTSINAKYNFNPASSNATSNNAKFTKSIASGKTLFTIVFKPTDFFDGDITSQTKMGILLKGNDWSNGQTTDFLADFWNGDFLLKLTSPLQRPLFVDNGEQIEIKGETPVAANYELFINNVSVDTKTNAATYSYVHTVTETSGFGVIKLVATAGLNSSETTFQYILSGNSPAAQRPAGIISGINYKADPTKVTLCLLAPGKTSVYAVGDFSDWDVLPENIMKRDGEYFWIELSGLTSGQEYAYQYLVDEKLFVADPYADKILDPDDQYIPATTYPNLKSFPQKAFHSEWYFNRLAVFQTNQQQYVWQVNNFEKPVKENLVVYELLIRDFFENGERNYQNLIDTIGYFKRLGINAIELMPIMEFNGNESWGYNPAFMFAPDKYYGTKNKFKEFIDVCHQNGIAVILDIAMNHQDLPNPYVMMDFNFTTYKPTATNKWFNTDARHPFNVFYDMNHESLYTKKYLDTVNYHWVKDYKVDGFRFDLSKGFTQVNNPSDVNAWSAYDASRIAILKRMADKIWSHTPDAYVILEHLAVNSEEKELAEYRAGEGKGMMLWGKMTDQYNQNTLGFASNSNISSVLHTTRGWTVPHLVGYMESHDEERLMYKNLQFGNASGTYKVKDLTTALSRMKAANAIFYTLPGPKMLWQFGEVGYDYSINHCPDGSNSGDCRISNKPVRWDYQDVDSRRSLYKQTAELIKLRQTYRVFTEGDVTTLGGSILSKEVTLKNVPYTATPLNTDEMNVHIVGNFDLTVKAVSVTFPHTGNWFHYFSGGDTLSVTASPISIDLQPGELRMYTDVKLPAPERELMDYVKPIAPELLSVEESPGKITLMWTDNSLVESSYKVYRKKAGGTYQLIGETAKDIESYIDAFELEAEVEYFYYVTAFNSYATEQSEVLSITTSDEIILAADDSFADYITIFPNPTGKVLTIRNENGPVHELKMHSNQGMKLSLPRISENSWDVSNLSQGLYVIEIRVGARTVRKKIIKQ